MSKLFLPWLLFVLCFANIILSIATANSLGSVIDDDGKDNMEFEERKSKRPHIVIIVADDMVSAFIIKVSIKARKVKI